MTIISPNLVQPNLKKVPLTSRVTVMSGIKKVVFYGKKLLENHAQHESRVLESSRSIEGQDPPEKRQRLLDPSDFWCEYSKQQKALDAAHQRSSSSLHTFVLQKDQGYRKFIVAHPQVYWQRDESRPASQRCSYEVIADGAPCHLYFDLEFLKDLNPSKDGPKMTKTLIDVFCAYLIEHWGFPCKRSDVLSLDSTTDVKFSRHLVFRLKNAMFKNNKHVGRFVKTICADIKRLSLDPSSINDVLKQFPREEVEELLVETDKGQKLFIDEGVYTKNRHFRIYKSTKWGKNSHLVRSEDSEYAPNPGAEDIELQTFLDSLISYIPNSKNLVLLEYQDNGKVDAIKYRKECLSQRAPGSVPETESNHPDIDKFILDIVTPGKIRQVKYLHDHVIYGIGDYRYCENIGRQHKSNGIYWIVDLHKKVAFQKCHDPDCAGFKSMPIKLPDKISFQLDEENDELLAAVPEPDDVNLPNQIGVVDALGDDSLDAVLTRIELDPYSIS